MRPWKAVRVFVNNAPDEWHVTTGEWGKPSLAVCASREIAEKMAAMPELLEAAQEMVTWSRRNRWNEAMFQMDIARLRVAISKATGQEG